MPIYEYRCDDCARTSEALQRIDDPPLTECPHCGGHLEKQVSAPAFQFKGSGWYVTDYARKSGGGSGGGDKGESGSGAKGGDGGEAKGGGDKPAAKPSSSSKDGD